MKRHSTATLRRFIVSAIIAATAAVAHPAGPANAQGLPNLGAIFGNGGVNPRGAVDMGLGLLNEGIRQQKAADARRRAAEAARREQLRRAELSKSKAGRAKLAREDAAARKRAKQQEQMYDGLARAIAGGILGGGGGGGSGGRNGESYSEYKSRCYQPSTVTADANRGGMMWMC